MKPIKLTIQAFGSYGEKTVIDFTRPEQNLFLITGDTGSGKSTIFDAIVFALYGEASSNSNKKSGKELQSQFTDGKKTTFVELTFTEKHGNEISQYTVRREPKQIKTSSNGKKSNASEKVILILPDGTTVSQKEANAKLSEIIILTKSQFMQISMIAQGEFMELLRSSSNDKKKILRKLFNTEIFDRIVDELKNRRKDLAEQIKIINNICQNEATHILIPEECENTHSISKTKELFINEEMTVYSLENLLTHLNTFCQSIENKKISAEENYNKLLNDSEKKRDQLKEAYNLLKNFEEMEQAEKEISECKKQEQNIRQKYDLIQKINSAYEIKAIYNRYADISVSVENIHNKLENQKNILPDIEKEYTLLIKEENKALELKNSATTEFIQTSERVKNNLETFEKIINIEKTINEKKSYISSSRKKAETIKNKISEFEKSISEYQEIIELLKDSEKLFFEWQIKNNEVERISDDYNTIVKINNEIILQKQKADKFQKEYINARQQYLNKTNEYTTKRIAFLDAQAGFIAMEQLHKGKPCPVCGSLEHPSPCKITDIHSSVTREIIDQLNKEVSELDNIQNKKSAQVKSALEILEERKKNLSDSMQKLYECMSKIIPDISEVPDIEQTGKILSEFKLHTKEEGRTYSDNLEKYNNASEMTNKYKIQINKLLPEFEKLNKNITEMESEISSNINLKKELSETLYYDDEISARKELSIAEKLKNEQTTLYNSIKDKLNLSKSSLEQTKAIIKKYSEELPEIQKTLSERKKDYINITEKYSLNNWNEITEKFQKNYTEILQSEIDIYNQKKLSAETLYNFSKKAIGKNSRPDIEELKKADFCAKQALETSRKLLETYNEIYKNNKNTYNLLSEQFKDYSRLSSEYMNVNHLYKKLSGTLSGEHMGIETFVQRYYLQKILDGANVHFRRMSGGQFELRLIDSEQAMSSGRTEMGLEFTVYSTINNSERPVKTLSGGETFISALALALGLSEQIQENIAVVNPDIIFIDEGFGSLDEHSRNQAVRVLKEMAEENRFIGIISHVTEMKQEIDNQLIVTKDRKGSHTHWVIN